MKIEYYKDGHRCVIEQLPCGKYKIVNDYYLEAYREFGCRSERVVDWDEVNKILGRLVSKGYDRVGVEE